MGLPDHYLDPALLRQALGDLSPLAGIREFVYDNGPAEGVRAAQVYNASGLAFTVLKSRALDIADASFKGVPLAYQGAPGITFPTQAYYSGDDFLWGFYGGLLLTGGLTYVGEPVQDGQESLGLHGRLNQVRARVDAVRQEWEGDDYVLEIRGLVKESRVFGPDMWLHRRISTGLNQPGFKITDRVTNHADVNWPHAMLYHISFGFPLVAPGSELVYRAAGFEAWQASVRRPTDPAFKRVLPPADPMHTGFNEDFTHILPAPSPDGKVCAGIINPELEIGVKIEYPLAQMPRLGLWLHYGGGGNYAVAYEPMTGYVEGRLKDREKGAYMELAPGESRDYTLEYTVLEGAQQLKEFKTEMESG